MKKLLLLGVASLAFSSLVACEGEENKETTVSFEMGCPCKDRGPKESDEAALACVECGQDCQDKEDGESVIAFLACPKCK